MTRKDYRLIATAIKEVRKQHVTYNSDGNAYTTVRAVEDELANVFASDNHRFDRGEFVRACGRE